MIMGRCLRNGIFHLLTTQSSIIMSMLSFVEGSPMRIIGKSAPVKSAPQIKYSSQLGPQEKKNTLVKSAPWKLLHFQRKYIKHMTKITI